MNQTNSLDEGPLIVAVVFQLPTKDICEASDQEGDDPGGSGGGGEFKGDKSHGIHL